MGLEELLCERYDFQLFDIAADQRGGVETAGLDQQSQGKFFTVNVLNM